MRSNVHSNGVVADVNVRLELTSLSYPTKFGHKVPSKSAICCGVASTKPPEGPDALVGTEL